MRRFVLFDFDGVIADTFEFASQIAVKRCALNTPDVYRSLFEGNIYERTNYLQDASHGPECNHDLDWWPEYQKGLDSTKVFPGIVSAVRELSESYSLCVITSSTRDFIDPFVRRHFGESPFVTILDHSVHHSKVVKMGMIFEKYGINSSDCVFVTDTLGDIREAKEHEMGVIACSWGFHSRETLEKGIPFRIVDRANELPQAIEDFFAKPAVAS